MIDARLLLNCPNDCSIYVTRSRSTTSRCDFVQTTPVTSTLTYSYSYFSCVAPYCAATVAWWRGVISARRRSRLCPQDVLRSPAELNWSNSALATTDRKVVTEEPTGTLLALMMTVWRSPIWRTGSPLWRSVSTTMHCSLQIALEMDGLFRVSASGWIRTIIVTVV